VWFTCFSLYLIAVGTNVQNTGSRNLVSVGEERDKGGKYSEIKADIGDFGNFTNSATLCVGCSLVVRRFEN